MAFQEERLTQSAASNRERVAEIEQDLQREALQCVHLREELTSVKRNVRCRALCCVECDAVAGDEGE